MNKVNNNLTTANDLTYIIIGYLIGIGILSLPNDVVKTAGQDGWISAIIGGVYPLYVVMLTMIIIKKYPNDSILALSKKYFGRIIGNTLNTVFMFTFVLILISITAGTSSLMRIYGASFISHIKICSISLALGAYGAYKGIKTIGRINKYVFFLIIVLLAFSLAALRTGRIINLQPVFGSGILNTLKASKETLFAYAIMEAILILHPDVDDKKGIIRACLKAVGITIIIYAWVVFISIYFLGINIIPKSLWSFILVTESVQLPIINNFRFIFMFLWLTALFRTIVNYYYAVSFIASDITGIKRNVICILVYPILLLLSARFENEIIRRTFVGKLMPFAVGFNIAYISIIALITVFKEKRALKGKTANKN